jgi:hypothetical protein
MSMSMKGASQSLSEAPLTHTQAESKKHAPVNIGQGWSFGASTAPSRHESAKMRTSYDLKPKKQTQFLKDLSVPRSGTVKLSQTKLKGNKDVFTSLKEILSERGLADDVSVYSGAPLSPKKYASSRSAYEDSSMGDKNTSMPFAMRASKTKVAAHEALKKGRKVSLSVIGN